jgi:hypothetical protein
LTISCEIVSHKGDSVPAPLCRYFERRDGSILIPPTSDIPVPPHCIERFCTSIRDVEALVRRMQQAAMDEADRAGVRQQIVWEPKLKAIRESLIAKMHTAGVSQYERDFITEWLKLRDEKKKEHYARLFEQRRVIAEALEFDRPQTAEEVLGESL